jgi:hypothetical protein
MRVKAIRFERSGHSPFTEGSFLFLETAGAFLASSPEEIEISEVGAQRRD